jgi:chemotaxis regulatin CheY-phosphate phosphatase CheZ
VLIGLGGEGKPGTLNTIYAIQKMLFHIIIFVEFNDLTGQVVRRGHVWVLQPSQKYVSEIVKSPRSMEDRSDNLEYFKYPMHKLREA